MYKIKIFYYICFLLCILNIAKLDAKDYGIYGSIFPIIEEDFLEFIKTALQQLENDGTLRNIEIKSIEEAKKKINRPTPVKNLKYATKSRKFYYDPSITLQRDYMDHKGTIFAKKGTIINPLNNEFIKWKNNLIFIDGDSKEQIKWALEQNIEYNKNVKIILTNGAVMDLMKQLNLKLYFDQGGILTSKFGIKNIPAIVKNEADKLLIEEVVLKYEIK